MVTVCPSQFATRRTLFHVLVGCGLLMLKVSRLKLPVIWLLVSMWLKDRKSGSAGMPRPISYAVFCLKKKILASADVELTVLGDFANVACMEPAVFERAAVLFL